MHFSRSPFIAFGGDLDDRNVPEMLEANANFLVPSGSGIIKTMRMMRRFLSAES
jgi:hypothetical protein